MAARGAFADHRLHGPFAQRSLAAPVGGLAQLLQRDDVLLRLGAWPSSRCLHQRQHALTAGSRSVLSTHRLCFLV